jgi:hypothetical protein
MTTVEIIQLVVITFLVPWCVALSWLAYNQGRENARLSERLTLTAGNPCSVHNSVMTGIDTKLDRVAQAVSDLTGFLRGQGHDGARGERGEREATGDRGAAE